MIENTNLFSSIGRRMTRLFSRHHDTEATLLHRLGRDLKSVVVSRQENSSEVATWWRHHRHHHSGERHPHRVPSPPHQPTTPSTNITVHTSETCYGPNEVLLIIAITCAVNFAFIFGVMTIVHLCNVRGHHTTHEALSSIVAVGHSDSLSIGDDEKVRRNSLDGCSLPGSMTLLLLPELEEQHVHVARPAWQQQPHTWQPPPPPRCRLSSQYQPLLAHSMEDLHILE